MEEKTKIGATKSKKSNVMERERRGVWGHAPLGNFDFGPFIRCNLVESGTVLHKHNLPFIVSLKLS